MRKFNFFAVLLLVCIMVLGILVVINASETEKNTTEEVLEAVAEKNLKIISDGANVEVLLAENGQYSYSYNSSKVTLTTANDGSTFEIKATAKAGSLSYEDRVKIYIPNQTYTLITAVSENGGLSLPPINADMNIDNNFGAVSVKLASDYSKTLNYAGVSCASSLDMNGNTDFIINAKFSDSAVGTPEDWPMYSNSNLNYSYASGNEMAKINIEMTKSAFSFDN